MQVMLICLVSLASLALLGWHNRAAGAGVPMAPGPARPAFGPIPMIGPIPANCVEHTSFDGGPDYPGDYRCAGLAIDYHLAGVARSPAPIWAGQWLFVDDHDVYRTGLCTFNRGIHPTTNEPSVPIAQTFPKDPSGAKRAYLTWAYGHTTDGLTAAGLWAVFHYYAQDAAGSNRSANASAPLVASLDRVSEASGNQDIEDLSIALDAEAGRFSGAFAVDVQLLGDGHGAVRVMSGAMLREGATVMLTVAGAVFGDDTNTVSVTTDSTGVALFEVSGPPHDVTVTASISAPSAAQVYRGAAADRFGHLPQTLITAGPAAIIVSSATTTLNPPEATTTTTTTVAPSITTQAQTTTSTIDATTTTPTEAPTTAPQAPTTVTTATEAPTTTFVDATTTMEIPSTVPSSAPIAVESSLPKTGSSNGPAFLATALLVAGVGVVGAVRRRRICAAGDDEWPGLR